MSQIVLINGSCADQVVAAVVNAANRDLWEGGGICGGDLADPAGESAKQCCRAYLKFVSDHPDYPIDVKLCAFSKREMQNAQAAFDRIINR